MTGQLEEEVLIGTPINIDDGDIYEDRKNDIEFQAEMTDLVGYELAKEFTRKYSRSDFVDMVNTSRLFNFNSEQETAEVKLQRIIKFHEWRKKLDSLNWMYSGIESITDSFDDFENLMNKIFSTNNKEIINYNPFIRDQLFGVASELLDKYGIDPKTSLGHDHSSQKYNYGHLARADSKSPKVLIPDMTTDELVDLCIDLKLAGTPARDWYVVEGFDSARTALEVSSFIDHPNTADLYVRYGFTSLEQVKKVDSKDLQKLERFFNPDNDDVFSPFSTYDEIRHHRKCVVNYIKGDTKRLEEMLTIGYLKGQDYLAAFDGDVSQTLEYLNLHDDKKASPKAVKYTNENFKICDFNEMVNIAKEIDTVQDEIFYNKFSTKEEFLEFSKDYHLTLNEFIEKSGQELDERGRLVCFDYNKAKEFNGDYRFLKNDFLLYNIKDVEKIENMMSFETYENLQVTEKSSIIPKLIDKGYTLEEMQEAFSGEYKAYGYMLRRLIEKSDEKIPLTELVQVENVF